MPVDLGYYLLIFISSKKFCNYIEYGASTRLSFPTWSISCGQYDQIWRNFKSIWQVFQGLFNIWQNYEPTLKTFNVIGKKFIVVKGQLLQE